MAPLMLVSGPRPSWRFSSRHRSLAVSSRRPFAPIQDGWGQQRCLGVEGCVADPAKAPVVLDESQDGGLVVVLWSASASPALPVDVIGDASAGAGSCRAPLRLVSGQLLMPAAFWAIPAIWVWAAEIRLRRFLWVSS